MYGDDILGYLKTPLNLKKKFNFWANFHFIFVQSDTFLGPLQKVQNKIVAFQEGSCCVT